jgi:hypothetical protein
MANFQRRAHDIATSFQKPLPDRLPRFWAVGCVDLICKHAGSSDENGRSFIERAQNPLQSVIYLLNYLIPEDLSGRKKKSDTIHIGYNGGLTVPERD